MTETAHESFVRRFAEIWAKPDPDRYAELWHEDGLLVHPTMSEPLDQSGIPDYVRRLQTAAPDIALEVDSWAGRGDTVLIEWTLHATVGDESADISGVDRFTLRGDRAVEGVAYFDTMPLWARIDGNIKQDEALEDRLHALAAAATGGAA